MRYVIGIDIGLNGTTSVIGDESGCLLGIGQSGFTNHVGEAGGRDRLQHSLEDSIRAARLSADLQNGRIAGACVIGAGEDDTVAEICCNVLSATNLIFCTEAKAALYASTYGKPGIGIYAGIGAAAFARNERHQERTVGGWGLPAGDEGSSTWIAQRALNACCRAADGVTPPTQILPLVLQQFESTNLQQLKSTVQLRNRNEVFAISDVVSRAAAKGDPIALKILRDGGRELALLVTSLAADPGFEQKRFRVSAAGAVFRSGRLVLRSFREVIRKRSPYAEILPARTPLSVGAFVLGLESLQIEINDRISDNLDISLPKIETSR